MSSEAIVSIDIEGKLPKVASGKVRDLFAIDDETLLFVASDRISAYDVVMENVSLWTPHAWNRYPEITGDSCPHRRGMVADKTNTPAGHPRERRPPHSNEVPHTPPRPPRHPLTHPASTGSTTFPPKSRA
jgi:hypothetical protein